MANTVTKNVLRDDLTHYTVLFNSVYVDAAEDNVVDISGLTMADTPAGRTDIVPTSLVLECIEWNYSANVAAADDYVTVDFDATTNDVILTMGANSSGEMDFFPEGGFPDPKSTGTTGDVVLTWGASTPTAGDSVMLKATFRKKA